VVLKNLGSVGKKKGSIAEMHGVNRTQKKVSAQIDSRLGEGKKGECKRERLKGGKAKKEGRRANTRGGFNLQKTGNSSNGGRCTWPEQGKGCF